MTTESMEPILSTVTEPSIKVIVELLLLKEDQLLSMAKAHLAVEVFPQISIKNLKNDPNLVVTMGFSLVGFLRERAARPAGKQLANLIRASAQDGGNNICNKLDYCNKRDAIKSRLNEIQGAIVGVVSLDKLSDELDEVKAYLIEILGNDLFETLETIVENVSEITQWASENMGWLTDISDPILLPVSLLLFLFIYAFDDLCQCDKEPLARIWPKS